MTDIYDITVTHMKIGIALPVVNSTFRFWDNPGTWSYATGWTAATVGVAKDYTAFDGDESAMKISAGSIPDDTTYNVRSDAKRFFNDNRSVSTSQDFYWTLAMSVQSMSGGTTPKIGVQLRTDSTSAMPSPTTTEIKTYTSTTSGFELASGTANHNPVAADKYGQILIYLRDASIIIATVDCIGVMFNPIDASGYYQLTNVFPANGPQAWYERLGKTTMTPLGTRKRFDPSGGAEKIRLSLQFLDVEVATYEALKYFHNWNWGSPGLPGVPLAIEPHLPGLPPMIMVDWVDKDFPLIRTSKKVELWSGICNFETVW